MRKYVTEHYQYMDRLVEYLNHNPGLVVVAIVESGKFSEGYHLVYVNPEW